MLKVGDKLRVKEDNFRCANVKVGQILTVEKIEECGFVHTNSVTEGLENCSWLFHLSSYAKGLELVEQSKAIQNEVADELKSAQDKFPKFNSAHEGFAILLEEVDELKAHVWKNQKTRDINAMKKEAIQVAAMAMRFVLDVCNEEAGRK